MERCNLTNKQNTKKRNYRNESSCFRLVLFVCYSFFKEMQITKLTKYMVWNCITILSIIFQGSFENLVSCGFSIYPFSSDFYIVWNSILRGNTSNWERYLGAMSHAIMLFVVDFWGWCPLEKLVMAYWWLNLFAIVWW